MGKMKSELQEQIHQQSQENREKNDCIKEIY